MWGNKNVEGWKCLQSGKRMKMTLVLGIEVTVSVPFSEQNGGH